ncbi:MAG: hypothetical protein EBZ69_07900 [Alphaproteobacteria bacterium]|nr:hypothetical protein [Alphaproteobacteria bacterium]NDC56712.1 hypothetical protein [Alphaproteobacteria bacterium]NDG04459.1 hypothetical protein [Alphaproteobacteria bacterium]
MCFSGADFSAIVFSGAIFSATNFSGEWSA